MRKFIKNIYTTHTYDKRIDTIKYVMIRKW